VSEKINLTELRATHDAMGGTVRVNQDELLALVEAVEAAKDLLDVDSGLPADLPGADEWTALNHALARFEFGQDR
jgi:hypothetical protein